MKYETPEINVIDFEVINIITTSDPIGEGSGDVELPIPGGDDWWN